MATALAPPPPGSPAPDAPPAKPRPKKKVRMQEVIIGEDFEKPVDVFHVEISDVRAVLRVAEPRPVVLSFEFDNYWYAETNVYAHDINPKWGFNAASIRRLDDRKPVTAPGVEEHTPRTGIIPAAKFVYETEFGYKLHRKLLIVKLSERSPYGDVEWGTGLLPLDSIARGCQRADISIVNKDNVTYGNIHCKVTMVNIQKVRAHLTDLKLSDYPEAYNYDVKLIYLEFGLKGFEDGYNKCTEKRSDGEPRYSAQPALEYHTSLRDMLVSSATGSPSLKIYFSVHRQVARTRTEEIGVGALPVRLLFSKVTEGWMDLPTKFKVPLANYKGVIRGKILLRNIPQFSQLSGDDLINVDGTIFPQEVDLTNRKLLPWVKLPRSLEAKSKSMEGANSKGLTQAKRPSTPRGTMANAVGQQPAGDVVEKPSSPVLVGANQCHSSVTESASDGSDSSAGSPHRKPRGKSNGISYGDADLQTSYGTRTQYAPADPEEARKSATSPLAVRDQIYGADPENSYDMAAEIIRAKLEGRSVPERNGVARSNAELQPRPDNGWIRATAKEEDYGQDAQRGNTTAQYQEWIRGMTRQDQFGHETRSGELGERTTIQPEWVRVGRKEEAMDSEKLQELGGLKISDDAMRQKSESKEQADARVNGPFYETRWEETKEAESELASVLKERRNKSSKSVGSAGTVDGGVEIGSVVVSTASDDGYGTGSRTTTEDALTASQRLSTGPPSEERYEVEDEGTGVVEMDGEEVGTNGKGFGYKEDGVEEEEEGEWLAILDPSSSRYYFAHKYTQESLWLPPEWERMEDEDGRQYFVDHGSRTTQREFPAGEARAYRESVYTSR